MPLTRTNGCVSPRFVPSDSVPFSLRQSLLELLLGFCEFRLHLPKTTNRTPTNSTRQEKISCLLISRVSRYSKLNPSTQLVYQRPPLYHKHEQPLKTPSSLHRSSQWLPLRPRILQSSRSPGLRRRRRPPSLRPPTPNH
jgi:hypothetical protein